MMLDSADNKIFFPRFYDIDTVCSYDNSGQLKFDVDIEMEQGYWNTSTSRLWTRMRELMHDDIVATYNNMRQNGVSYENMMKYIYDEQIAKIPQSYYLKDYDVKYAPFADSYIGMANGDTYEHAKRWLTQRFRFCDSLFDYEPSYNNDILTIRANTTELMTLEIETYTPVYQHLSWYNGQMDKKKIDGKVETEFSGKAMAATDQEILIYGGSNVKSIKGIQSANPNRLILGSATKLIELDASNCPLLSEINMNKANLSPHTYLNKLNLENCPLLDGNLRLNASPLIREINIKGTNISGLNLPSSLRSLEVMKLPKTLTGFTLNDATSLHTLDFEEGIVLNDVSMTNCNALTNVTNFDLSNAQQVTLNNSYNTTNELYFKNANTLSLSNMSNLEKVIYTPNAEHETFDITNLANTKDYNITTFNCPKLSTFMTTAPYRESYGKEYGEIKPNEVFEANTIDISNTQFTDVKLLCTTDTNVLKLPQTVKNLIIDSAYDLDTNYLTDGDYDTIHTELYEPYNTDYEGKVRVTRRMSKLCSEFGISETGRFLNVFNSSESNADCDISEYIEVVPSSTITASTYIQMVHIYDENKNFVARFPEYHQHEITIPTNGRYMRFSAYRTQWSKITITYMGYETPNVIPSASDGSIIQSIYAPTKTVQPTSGVWDLKGLELEDYHTFGLNNDVKPSYDFIDKKSIILEGKNLNWSFSWGAYDSTTILNDGIESITPLTGADYIFNCFDKDNNNIQWVQLVQAGTKITIPENTYTIAIDCVTSGTQSAMFDVVYNIWGVSQIQMPDRYDEYSLSIKNKTVKNEIAKYTASDWNTLPTFNSEFTYTYDITKLDDGIYEYSIMADSMDNLPTSISFNGKSNLLTVEYLNVDNVTNMYQMFYACYKLTSLDVSNWDTSNVTNMQGVFQNCNNLISLDVSNWDTSNVTNMGRMFNNCINLTSITFGDNFKANNVKSMWNMFEGCNKLTSLDLSNFDTTNVTSMQNMFYGCTNLQSLNLSDWDTSSVTNMNSMFYNCYNLQSLDLSSWDTTNVTNMRYMFDGCKNLTSLDLSNWNTSKVTDMEAMFQNCQKLTTIGDISNWNTNKVTSMYSMFGNCRALTFVDVSNFDISKAIILSMFQNCRNLTQLDVSNWDTSNVKSMNNIFHECRNLTSIGDISNWDTSNVIAMSNMFFNCNNLTSLDVSNFDTSKVTDMESMFSGCYNLTSLDVSNFDTSEVTDMSYMFNNCQLLTLLDVSNWNTNKVTNMYGMFSDCRKLTSLNASNWNTSKVTDMTYIFYGCQSLVSLDSMQNISVSLALSSTKLNQTSLVDVINNLKTVTTTQTLTLGSTLLAKLTEEQIAVAVSKGWSVV